MSTVRTSPPQAAAELSYERSVPWYAKRRNFYLIVFLLLLNVVATTSISWGPTVVNAIRSRLEARRAAKAAAAAAAQQAAADAAADASRVAGFQTALAWTSPDGRVVYSEDPGEAARLLAGSGYSQAQTQNAPQRQVLQLPVLADETARWPDGPLNHGVVMLHGRTASKADGPRLIRGFVEADCQVEHTAEGDVDNYAFHMRRSLYFEVWAAPTSGVMPRRLWRLQVVIVHPEASWTRIRIAGADGAAKMTHPGDGLRLMAAQSDPADNSRWTEEYESGGKSGTVRFRLREDDRIDFEAPVGEVTKTSFDTAEGVVVWDAHRP